MNGWSKSDDRTPTPRTVGPGQARLGERESPVVRAGAFVGRFGGEEHYGATWGRPVGFLSALPKLTERAWAGQVDRLAKLLGWAMWRDNATNAPRACPRCRQPIKLPRNTPGWPDRVYVRGDRLVFVEFKADRGRLSDEQRDWLTALMAVRRVEVYVARPKDADRMQEVLR